ncbi:MAG: ABC transporter substrate-binding protein [Euryarchaeota archaeon]|nr:ABC transporter substrate-binding protein [Euryarchaeota archaeon]
MRTNTLLLGIAISLLLALPAAASDYTLDIFGNANEDDTINMQDVTYTELIILEYRDKTELADAKYDGKINMQDVTQIELTILGKEKEMTFRDILGEAETVNKPIERLANLGNRGIVVTRSLNAMDILLPIGPGMAIGCEKFFPVISTWQIAGSDPADCDFEYVLSLNPDAVQTNIEGLQFLVGGKGERQKRMFEEKLPGIPLISLNMREQDAIPQSVKTYGYIIDRRDEACEFVDWFEGSLNLFKSQTEGLTDYEKPRFLMSCQGAEPYKIYCSGSRYAKVLNIAGGRNIADEICETGDPNYGHTIDVDPEWMIEKNPDYIIFGARPDYIGYETDDPSNAEAYLQEFLAKHPELARVNAVEDGHVYMLPYFLLGGAGNTVVGSAYAAKLFHPDLFEDFDPQALHQDYVDRFCHIDFDVREHGIFVYPPLEES